MTRDFTELDRQIDNAEAHDLDQNAPGRQWNQETWFAPCGTSGCLAGNTCLDHGYVAVISLWGTYRGLADVSTGMPVPTSGISKLASGLLGLTPEEGQAFFLATNTIGVLRRLQKDLHDGREVNIEMAMRYCLDEQMEKNSTV